MRKILLDGSLNYYRVNLHCHTTISDGCKTPEEVKAFYKSRGYSAVAFTDHDVLIPHNDLSDEGFIALNGLEHQIYGSGSDKTCHICFVALDPDNFVQPCFHKRSWILGNTGEWFDKVQYDKTRPPFVPAYTHERISAMMLEGRETGFFVTYNHPTWSCEDYTNYMGYDGMHAMEMVNYSCTAGGYDDDNGHQYDDMLRGGKRIFCIGADDNHNREPDDDPSCDSFGGYTMVGAKELSYKALTDALLSGSFYAAQGSSAHDAPLLKSIVCDTEARTVTVETSPVRAIQMITSGRPCRAARAPEGETITTATFSIPEKSAYLRFVATDTSGYKAYSNAYHTGDL